METRERTTLTIKRAARQARVDVTVVRHCIKVGVLKEELTQEDLAELRRVRRLKSLGINLAGIEVILRMRRRIEALEAEIARLNRRLRQ